MRQNIFIISDGSGRTAEFALKAALTQFHHEEIEFHLRSNVRSEEEILQIVQEAVRINGIIVHTLVSDDLRNLIRHIASIQNVDTVDILGPLLAQLSKSLALLPSQKPGLFSQLNEAYFRRIDAMEFAIRHDDGQRLDEIHTAEIVILGVSRTFKTPISIYLAFKGWFVANIPIILEMELPPQLKQIPAQRIVALTTNAGKLAALRRARDEHLKKATGHYADIRFVQKELDYAMNFYIKNPNWHRVDVTDKPIEEIASGIIDYMGNIKDKK